MFFVCFVLLCTEMEPGRDRGHNIMLFPFFPFYSVMYSVMYWTEWWRHNIIIIIYAHVPFLHRMGRFKIATGFSLAYWVLQYCMDLFWLVHCVLDCYHCISITIRATPSANPHAGLCFSSGSSLTTLFWHNLTKRWIGKKSWTSKKWTGQRRTGDRVLVCFIA